MNNTMKWAVLLLAVTILGGIFCACENPLYPNPAHSGGASSNSNTPAVDVWDPVMVIVLKTTDGQVGTLSFALTEEGEGTAALADGTYAYRLHVAGDIFSKGTVTVTNNGAKFTFVSVTGNEFTGKIENNHFEFITGYILPDSEDGEALEFGSAKVPAEPSDDAPVVSAQSIALSYNDAPEPLTLNINDTAALTAAILPVDADTQVWWTTDKLGVIRIAPNETGATITALKGGTATIKVKTVKGGKSAECTVTVIRPVVAGFFQEDGEDLIPITLAGVNSPLAEAIAYINSASANSGESFRLVLDDTSGETTADGYTVAKNITLSLSAMSIEAGTISVTAAAKSVFTFANSGTANADIVPHLVLDDNITITSTHIASTKPLLAIGTTTANKLGKLTMLEGSRVTGITGYSGVQVNTYGTFIMESGVIDYCTDASNTGMGAGVYTSGTFTMKGGVIENNTVGNSSSGTAPKGGGVYMGGGTFIMSGGVIRNNKTLSSHTNPSSQAGGQGGGVIAKGIFTMETGTDANGNTTVPIIEGNTASRGGGIANVDNNATTITISGGIIRNNHATFDNTGSAFERYNGANVRFIKTGGTIYGINETVNSNCKTDNVGQGYAIVLRNGTYSTAITNYRNDTAGDDVSLDSTSTGTDSGWSAPEN
jgi:hypothetical protein